MQSSRQFCSRLQCVDRDAGVGAVVRALAFHQCGPGSIPGLGGSPGSTPSKISDLYEVIIITIHPNLIRTFSHIPIFLHHTDHCPPRSMSHMQCRSFPPSHSCFLPPSHLFASAPQAHQLHQDPYSSHSPLDTAKRKQKKT